MPAKATGSIVSRMERVALLASGIMGFLAVALAAIGYLSTRTTSAAVPVGAVSMLIGIALFSGSLYVMTLTGIRALGAITPLGGLAFLVGWIAIAVAAWSIGS